MNAIPDHRSRRTYQVAEIIMAGLMMFVFKRGSKNNTNQLFTPNFEKNYFTIFGLRLPVMATVHQFLESLPAKEIERIKHTLIHILIEKRVLDKFRFNNQYVVAVDGTGVFSFDEEPFEGCPYKTSKNGKKTWQAGVLEAKIICSNGFSISMETEWYQNSDNIEDKQDCELKAFKRLSSKLKKNYPRMALTIVADSLYPNETFFKICNDNKWNYILTFKDGTLKSIWHEINSLYPIEEKQNKQFRVTDIKYKEETMFLNNIKYKEKYTLYWCEYIRKYTKSDSQDRFVHVTNININHSNVWEVSYYGRLRWKIENEGFNTQKKQGYNLEHKYAEKNFNAMQNYYQLLQIGHLFNQLTEKLESVKAKIKTAQLTIKALFEDTAAAMKKEVIEHQTVLDQLESTKQLRY